MHAWCKKLKGICFDEEPQLPKKERGDDIIMRISAQFSSKSSYINGCVWILGTLPNSIHFPCWIILGYRMLRQTQVYTPYCYVYIYNIHTHIPFYPHHIPNVVGTYPFAWRRLSCRIAEPKLLKSIGRPRWTRLGSGPVGFVETWGIDAHLEVSSNAGTPKSSLKLGHVSLC